MDDSSLEFVEEPVEARKEEEIPPSPPLRIGDVLRKYELITEQQLDRALAEGKRLGLRVGEALVQLQILNQDQINWALAQHLEIPYLATLTEEMVDKAWVGRLPNDLLRGRRLVPLLQVDETLTCAMADPTDTVALKEVERLAGVTPTAALANQAAVDEVLERVLDVRIDPSVAAGGLLQRHLEQARKTGADQLLLIPGADGLQLSCRQEGRLVQHIELTPEASSLYRSLLERADTGDVFLGVHSATILDTDHGPACAIQLGPGPLDIPEQDSAISDLQQLLAHHRRGLGVISGANQQDGLQLAWQLGGALLGATGDLGLVVGMSPPADQRSWVGAPLDHLERAFRFNPRVAFIGALEALDDRALGVTLNATVNTIVLATMPRRDVDEAVATLADRCRPSSLLGSSLLFILGHTRLRRLCPHCRVESTSPPPTGTRFGAVAVPRKTASGCRRCSDTGTTGARMLLTLLDPGALPLRLLLEAAPVTEVLSHVEGSGLTLRQRATQLVAAGEVALEEALAQLG
jgi:hypothetical protein